MYITYFITRISRHRRYIFPYNIGTPSVEGALFRRWRPVDSTPLSGGIAVATDTFGVDAKLLRLAEFITAARQPIEWIDVTDKRPDELEVKLSESVAKIKDVEQAWKGFEAMLSRAFGLEVRQ